jgi:hypothetical protein
VNPVGLQQELSFPLQELRLRDPLIRCLCTLFKNLAPLQGMRTNDMKGAPGFGYFLASAFVLPSCDLRLAVEILFGGFGTGFQVPFD